MEALLLLLEVPEPAHCEQVEGVPQPQFSREAEEGYTAAGWWPWSPPMRPADEPASVAVLVLQSTLEAWPQTEWPVVQAEPAAVGTQVEQAEQVEQAGTPVVDRLVVLVQLVVGRRRPVPCVGEEVVVDTLAALAEGVGRPVEPVVEAAVAGKPVALAVEGVLEGVVDKQAGLVVGKLVALGERAVRSRGEPVLQLVGHTPLVGLLAEPPAEELVD